MNERIPCEFFLLRYVPDVVKGEFVNIGVVLRNAVEAPGKKPSTLIRFTRDWNRVRCLHGDADIGLLENVEAGISSRLEAERAAALGDGYPRPILDLLQDSLSNSVQISEPRACLAESMALEMDLLMRLYVESMRVPARRKPAAGRAAIAAAMRTEFERAGVWAIMRKRISAALYTRQGNPMKIDCGYRPNGVIRMFHAVSLEADVEAAKVLAHDAPGLRKGVFRVEAATLQLNAVVEPLRAVASDDVGNDDFASEDFTSEAAERYRYGVEEMELAGVRVLTINDLARAAETARLELRL